MPACIAVSLSCGLMPQFVVRRGSLGLVCAVSVRVGAWFSPLTRARPAMAPSSRMSSASHPNRHGPCRPTIRSATRSARSTTGCRSIGSGLRPANRSRASALDLCRHRMPTGGAGGGIAQHALPLAQRGIARSDRTLHKRQLALLSALRPQRRMAVRLRLCSIRLSPRTTCREWMWLDHR